MSVLIVRATLRACVSLVGGPQENLSSYGSKDASRKYKVSTPNKIAIPNIEHLNTLCLGTVDAYRAYLQFLREQPAAGVPYTFGPLQMLVMASS